MKMSVFLGGARREYRPYRFGRNKEIRRRLRCHFWQKREDRSRGLGGNEDQEEARKKRGQEADQGRQEETEEIGYRSTRVLRARARAGEPSEPCRHFQRNTYQRYRGTFL